MNQEGNNDKIKEKPSYCPTGTKKAQRFLPFSLSSISSSFEEDIEIVYADKGVVEKSTFKRMK